MATGKKILRALLNFGSRFAIFRPRVKHPFKIYKFSAEVGSMDRQAEGTQPTRRGFLGWLAPSVMFSGLAAGYGTLAGFAARFLYPTRKAEENWQFVANVSHLTIGKSMSFATPGGSKIVVARNQEGDSSESFVALSSVCPHLGCSVHWEAQNNRFFCPCHNGAFDPSGKATEGPPASANQSLKKFPLKVENGILYIAISSDSLA